MNIGQFCVIEEKVKFGKRVHVGNHVTIYRGTIIGDDCWIEDNAILGRKPRSGASSIRKAEATGTPLYLGRNVVIGTGVVIYENNRIEDDCLIADYAAVREGCFFAKGVRIGRLVTIEPNVVIGENTVIQTAAHMTGDMIIEANVFVGPEVCSLNDKKMARVPGVELRGPTIRRGASIGANSTLVGGVEIGENAIIGAGAIVTKNVPPAEIWIGVAAESRWKSEE